MKKCLEMRKISVKEKLGLILFGLFLCAVLLEIAMRIGSFAISFLQDYRNQLSLRRPGQYRIVCLGESTTALEGENSYPSQLEEILNKMDLGVRFSVINAGKGGVNTLLILSELEPNLNKYLPDIVITMMGANDNQGKFVAAYPGMPNKGLLFVKPLRVYKLVKLLSLHIRYKLQELRLYAPNKGIIDQAEELCFPLFFDFQKELPEGVIEKNPKAYQAYMEFKRCFMSQEMADTVEERFEKTIKINPNNAWGYIGLGRRYWYFGKRDKAEEMFRRAAEIDPQNEWVYLEIGECHSSDSDYDKLEEIFKKVIEINPNNVWGYVALGWCNKGKKDYDKAEKTCKKAIEIDPKNETVYVVLGDCYRGQGEYEKAEEAIKKAIEINPYNDWAYLELGSCYWDQKKYDETKRLLEGAIARGIENERLYGILVQCYKNLGDYKLAEEYVRKADRLKLQYYNPMTRYSYQRLQEIVAARGIKLVCAQYPIRSLEPLKKMFDSAEGIIFVDNEKVFKDALKHGKYEDYFTDSFGGDFGHCTRKGNRLLAENVANAIIRECFNKHE